MAALIGIAATSVRNYTAEERLRAVTDARVRGASEDELKMLLHDTGAQPQIPVGIGLLGLIPVGIGVAYLIFYTVERKKLVP